MYATVYLKKLSAYVFGYILKSRMNPNIKKNKLKNKMVLSGRETEQKKGH